MNKKAKRIELMTNDGQVILSLLMVEKEIDLGSRNNGSENAKMTEAQEKYLLKILAEQGIKGDEANQRLLELFKVKSLKDVTKSRTSEMIKTLLQEKGDDQNKNNPPL